MFNKPFKVKSNNQVKSTERKKLWEEIIKLFPQLADKEMEIFPKTEPFTMMKIITHNGQLVKLYCSGQLAMFFSLDLELPVQALFPTIYTLWRCPKLLHTFTIWPPTMSKLTNGADLMLPGLTEPKLTLRFFGKFPKGTPASINTKDNRAPFAVGIMALSSFDMYMAGGSGKCVQIFHVIGDNLCQLGKSPPRPNLGTVEEEVSNETNDESVDLDEFDELEIDETKIEEMAEIDPDPDPVQQMDNLVEYCFFKACKTSIKPTDLPMIASNFYKNHLLAACPTVQTINIKKSRYKKLSVFLAAMAANGIVQTSVTKGVESLLSIQFNHPLLQEFRIVKEDHNSSTVTDSTNTTAVVAECYKVTADVAQILSKFGYKKGDAMKRSDIRKCFMDYVKSEELQDGKTLKLNPVLAGLYKTGVDRETLTMEDGINKFIGRMTLMHEVTLAGTKLLRTGKLTPIDMRIALRANGKKATLINNLETFGINPKEFSKECQSIGASATIVDDPGKKTPSVLVQGNQILHVYKLLTEKYQIRKTYIRGLEFAQKKKQTKTERK